VFDPDVKLTTAFCLQRSQQLEPVSGLVARTTVGSDVDLALLSLDVRNEYEMGEKKLDSVSGSVVSPRSTDRNPPCLFDRRTTAYVQ
jgi:hypothetical protein